MRHETTRELPAASLNDGTGAAGSPQIHFRILGPIEYTGGNRTEPLAGRQSARLLALLLVHANRALSHDEMIEMLWSDHARDADAKRRLQVAIVRLRRALGAEGERSVQTVAGGYRLTLEPGSLDADVFASQIAQGRRALDANTPQLASELLSSALALWRGPPLAEVTFEPFAQSEIRRLEGLRLIALEARIDADLKLGRHADVALELEGLVAAHATQESFVRQLMLALYRCGRQSNALEAFQRARRRLAEELGLQPGPVLRAMEASVLAHDPELDHIAPASSFAHLIVNDGPGAQRLLRLDARQRLTLGRDPSNDITLPEDATVSRLHALLERIHGSWILSDDGVSSNGTFCNEERVRRRRLKDGDVLRLGDTLLVFRDPRSAAQDGTLSKPA